MHPHHDTGTSAHRSDGPRAQRPLALVLALVLIYMVVEIVGGLKAGSLALLADAGHMFSDGWALGLAVAAAWLAGRPATPRHTYGYYRAEILAALVNAGALVAVAVLIFWEAVNRLGQPREVDGALLMLVASGGLAVNLLGLWILHRHQHANLNVRAAWWHVMGDALGSLQAVVAGSLVLWLGWTWADSIASMVIAVLVVYASWSIMRDAVAVLMESAPAHVDMSAVRARLLGMPGVTGVHDLHVWTIGSGLVALSAHLSANRPPAQLLRELRDDLRERFGIAHTTIEFDPPSTGSDGGDHALPM